MVTLKADNRRRVQLPDAKPGQIFAYTPNGDGTVTLTLVKAEAAEPFPEGSLKHLVTPERDKELLDIHRGSVHGPLGEGD
jgi:hypothetical protein